MSFPGTSVDACASPRPATLWGKPGTRVFRIQLSFFNIRFSYDTFSHLEGADDDDRSWDYNSQDPIGLEGNNPNLYAYVSDTNAWVDPFGLDCGKAKGGKGGAKGASKEVNRIYSARELVRRSAEPGSFHNFPESFNKIIFKNGRKTITPNYFKVAKPGLSNTNILYKYPGTINGTKGFYEIGVRPSISGNTEVIIHRFFNPIR